MKDVFICLILFVMTFLFFSFKTMITDQEIKINTLQSQLNTIQLQMQQLNYDIPHIGKNIKLKEKN